MNFKTTLAIVCAVTLMAPNALASASDNKDEEIDFSDPRVVYTSGEAGYGSEGLNLAFGYASTLPKDWALLSKAELREDFNEVKIRAITVQQAAGYGFMADYQYRDDVSDHAFIINGLYVWDITPRFKVVPMLGGGFLVGDDIDNTVGLGMAHFFAIYNFSPSVWLNVYPKYTHSFNDIKGSVTIGDSTHRYTADVRTLDVETFIGYRFMGNQNVKAYWKALDVTDNTDHQYWLQYTYAF